MYESSADDDFAADQLWIVPTSVSPPKDMVAGASCARVVDGLATRADTDQTVRDLISS